MEYMKEFLKNEDRESFDNFWENSQKLVWIDWREYDEDIINSKEKNEKDRYRKDREIF